MNDVVDNFKLVFTHLDASNIELIDNLYEKNVTFIDPFNEIRGLGPLRSYFDELYKNVLHCEFQFNETYIKDNSAIVIWNMLLTHKTLASAIPIEIAGSTQIRFNNKIYFHRDYFDGGQMLYERLPVIGPIIRIIKKQV